MVALATSAEGDQLNAMLEVLGAPEATIDHITKKDDVDQSKPSPDIFQVVLEATGLNPENTIVVGDTA